MSERTLRENVANEIRYGWHQTRVPSDVWDDLSPAQKAPWMEAALRILEQYKVEPKAWEEYVDE